MLQQPLLGHSPLNIEASRSHSDTRYSVGLLWKSDRLVAETYTSQHTTLTRDIHVPAGFETAIPASERPQTHALDCAVTGTGTYPSIDKCIKISAVTSAEYYRVVSASLCAPLPLNIFTCSVVINRLSAGVFEHTYFLAFT